MPTRSYSEVVQSVLGKTPEEAQRVIEAEGYTYRLGMRDLRVIALTVDNLPDRITVAVLNGVVTGVTRG